MRVGGRNDGVGRRCRDGDLVSAVWDGPGMADFIISFAVGLLIGTWDLERRGQIVLLVSELDDLCLGTGCHSGQASIFPSL